VVVPHTPQHLLVVASHSRLQGAVVEKAVVVMIYPFLLLVAVPYRRLRHLVLHQDHLLDLLDGDLVYRKMLLSVVIYRLLLPRLGFVPRMLLLLRLYIRMVGTG